MTKEEFAELIWGFMKNRKQGEKELHRKVDKPAGSSSPMKLNYVPVGKMFFEGTTRILNSGANIPLIHKGDPKRNAVEGYPALVAKTLIGSEKYKSGKDRNHAKNNRKRMLEILQEGSIPEYGIRLSVSRKLENEILSDELGDNIDSILCLVQASWAYRNFDNLPEYFQDYDPDEGWIADPSLKNIEYS